MATTALRPAGDALGERSNRSKQGRIDIWTTLLKQTQEAQSRNRSNAIAHKELLVCGGSPQDQRDFLSSLTRPPPSQPLRRARHDKSEQKEKGALALSNRYAYGYGHFSLYSAQQTGPGVSSLGAESDEIARLQCHCIPKPDITYEKVVRRVLRKQSEDEDDGDSSDEKLPTDSPKRNLAVHILLSWKEPWNFLQQLRAWLQLCARALAPDEDADFDNLMQTLIDRGIAITVVVQHVEAQQDLEREGWTEETFDHVCQVLRTILLPLHPWSALIYTPSTLPSQLPGSSLSEVQKVTFSALDLDLVALSPRPSSSGDHSGTSIKKDELLPKHNVVDRMNIVIPHAWDSTGKVRLLSETFSPEEVTLAWANDMNHSVFPQQTQQEPQPEVAETIEAPSRPEEEVFTAEPSSPVSSISSPPPSPSKAMPSTIRSYEARIVDPNAHKAPKPATITVLTRPEQEFLREMKAELDSHNAKDRERNVPGAAGTPVTNRILGIPTGDSTGALDSLGDVSFNIGGVSYNSTSAEAAIERLKRPHAPGVYDGSSPSLSATRSGTPRQPRRLDSERDVTPGATTPSSNKTDFPADDLEKYFASLAKKAGPDSRQGTPSRQ